MSVLGSLTKLQPRMPQGVHKRCFPLSRDLVTPSCGIFLGEGSFWVLYLSSGAVSQTGQLSENEDLSPVLNNEICPEAC